MQRIDCRADLRTFLCQAPLDDRVALARRANILHLAPILSMKWKFPPIENRRMMNVSLRSQIFVIVIILVVALAASMIYVTATIGLTRESIIRFDRERLSSLTDDLSRRYGSILNFVSPAQVGNSSLAERQDLTKLVYNITEERLQNAMDVRAGFFHSVWNRQLADIKPAGPSGDIVSADHYLRIVLQLTIDQRAQQWGHYETGSDNFIIVASPVIVRNNVVGAAWAVDDLAAAYSSSRPFDVRPLFQLALVVGILLSSFFVINLRREVNVVRRGLEVMKTDISKHLPQSRSELGHIASSINGLADTIVAQMAEREALQQTIQHGEKMASLGQLIAGVAHEIRTPLSVIKTRVQLWQRAFGSRKRGTKEIPAAVVTPSSMKLVVDELDRMDHIVRKLLYFSKQRKLHFARTNIHALLDSALATLEEPLRSNRVRITKSLSLNDPLLYIDGPEMKEVVLNLLTNAIEAMPLDGEMTLTTRAGHDPSTVELCIEDTGKKIGFDVSKNMFDPFFTTKETGTGLGLSIVYEIVRAHHGTIQYSHGKKGSCFTITLPRDCRNHAGTSERAL